MAVALEELQKVVGLSRTGKIPPFVAPNTCPSNLGSGCIFDLYVVRFSKSLDLPVRMFSAPPEEPHVVEEEISGLR